MIFAYLHHLYVDFAQPRFLQDLGQISSYFISIPAAVVSIFGCLTLVYALRMRWTLASSLYFLDLMGWAIGGVGAVVDSTVSVNFHFHNTLWVPAHSHSYYLMGVVLMLLGFASHLGVELSGEPDSPGCGAPFWRYSYPEVTASLRCSTGLALTVCPGATPSIRQRWSKA